MISLQISMLQDELSRLTLTELDKREERQDVERVCNLGFHSSIKLWNQKDRLWMDTTKRILTYSFNRRVVLTLIEFTLRSDISREWTPLSMIKWWDCSVTVLKPFVRFSWFIFDFSTVYFLYLYRFLRWWQGLLICYMLFDEKCGWQKRKAHEGFRKWLGSVGAWRKNNCKLLGVCGGIYNSKASASCTTGRILSSLFPTKQYDRMDGSLHV